jgi:nucleoid-associated protein YgaU
MALVRMIIGGLAGVAVAGGVAVLLTPRAVSPPDAIQPPPIPDASSRPAVAEAAQDAEQTAQPDRAAPPTGPRLDVARVERDGAAVFAGTAEPNAVVELRRDGAVVATAIADDAGDFVAYGTVAAGEKVARLDLVSRPQGVAGAATEAPVFVARPDDGEPNAAPVVAMATPDGVEVLQPRALGPDETLSLDSVSFASGGDVVLSGRGPPDAPLLIFANARVVGTGRVRSDGRWRADASALRDPGDYTLRVAALDDAGEEIDSVTSPFVRPGREAAEVGPGEVLIQPGDTLWGVAQNLYGSGARYTVIYGANRAAIRDPNLIYPGQILTAPPRAAD